MGYTLVPMMKKLVHFHIVPIFNQDTANVWHDFLKIEFACDKAIYGQQPPVKAIIKNRLGDYENNLHEYRHNFAFGAYSGHRMIGFIQGFSVGPYEVYLNRLYVSPKYHKCGIGTQLLNIAEQSMSIFANKISLISSSNAIHFYEQKHGYTQRDYMEKQLEPAANTIVPVFQWVKKDFNMEIICPVETMELKQSKFQPVFVHINKKSQIDGVATRTLDGQTKIWTNGGKAPYRTKLLKNLDKTR